MWLQHNEFAIDPELTKEEIRQTLRFYKQQPFYTVDGILLEDRFIVLLIPA
jgi:hypothetical protein